MNLQLVEHHTHSLVAAGHRVLQIHRFATGEASHVARLARWAEFPEGARVLDMGSGTGEVARLMHATRPDLRFELVNISQAQLGYSPDGMVQHCTDFCSVPVADGSFDAGMFCFSIGHEDVHEAMAEVGRIMRNGGVLFVYDMVRVAGDNSAMAEVEYSVHGRDVMESAARLAGFSLDFYMEPRDDGGYGLSLFGDDFLRIFAGTIPAVWRFVKC